MGALPELRLDRNPTEDNELAAVFVAVLLLDGPRDRIRLLIEVDGRDVKILRESDILAKVVK